MVKRDINAFRERFSRWKNGELVYDKGRPITDDLYVDIMEKVAIENNPKWNRIRQKEGGNVLSEDLEFVRILNDNTYDYRGYYNKYPNSRANADTHWTDEFKTAYHPTFSTYSKYSGKKSQYNTEGVLGGHWDGEKYIPAWGLKLPSYYKTYSNGKDDENNPSLDSILRRATRVYNNYSDAKDFNMNPFVYGIRKTLNNAGLRSGISNCTLSATLWIDPKNPIKSAATIFDPSGNSGYYRISEDEALPGDLLITKNPERGSYHTMLIESYDKNNKPVLRYSTGGPTNDSLRTGVSLDAYHQKDNDQGGNHTEDYYFRYGIPIYTSMKPVIIKPANNNFFGFRDGKDSGIHIKPSHRGRLTALKKRTGKSEAELYRTGGPAVRKMITFARNARKWHHD